VGKRSTQGPYWPTIEYVTMTQQRPRERAVNPGSVTTTEPTAGVPIILQFDDND